jgi:hypothetical protein
MADYALYQGDVFVTLGTLAQISSETGITERMLKYYTYTSHQRRNPNGRAVIKIEEEE